MLKNVRPLVMVSLLIPVLMASGIANARPMTASVRYAGLYGGPSIRPAVDLTQATVAHSFNAGLAMISVPSDYGAQSLASVLGYQSPVLAVWNPSSVSYAVTPNNPANSLNVGLGYWVRFPAAESIASLGTATPTGGPFAISLHTGWNMLGDPFPAAVQISHFTVTPSGGSAESFASAVSSQAVDSVLYTFQSGDSAYEVVSSSSGSISPYEGYWLYSFGDCTLNVRPPSTPATVAIPVVNDSSAPMGFSFQSPVSAHSGDLVHWANGSSAPHGITWEAQSPLSSPAPGADIPIFSGGAQSQVFTVPTVTVATTYNYHCTIHGVTMHGQINVTP